ncbi:DUF4055 domain-containing protein [Acinetobacter sp. Ver3]|uniref:DUF4055 domain-containing protein n=1 Tax=Acinetobacter sp. Ver3 TaxID=466088 RepID=UPI000451FA8C|nr:DUF4055 domain-containing protein [Acinetobacter sp. Ver3]EZQ10749.1 hypothetical protein CL42_06345 [Acinetobacter sp. Ver3]
MSITSKHADYEKHVKVWEKLDHACSGQETVKSKNTAYLPKPALFGSKNDETGDKRYKEYIARASFPGVTKTTLANHIGLAFGKVPVFNRPEDLEYLERNADGGGRSIHQVAQRATRLIEMHYRCGVYVDYPVVPPSRSKAEERQKGAFPMIHIIDAKSIEDWDYIVVGNQKKLSYVKILETVKTRDGFDVSESKQYRVLWLKNIDGRFVYSIEVFVQDEKGDWLSTGEAYPRDYNGQTWDYIPFTFCGGVDNSEEIHMPALYELAEIEFSYYRSSADVEESAFVVGQPTLCLPNITDEQYKMVQESGAQVGSRSGIPADAKFIQADENGLAYKRMQDKWDQMKEMGARLIEVGSANKTATQADNENSVQHSVLSLVVANVSEALTIALRWCAKFAMPTHDFTTKELSFTIAQDFNKPKYDPARSRLIYEACLNGSMPWFVWYHYEQTGTFTESKWEDVVKQIEAREDGIEDE